MDIDAVTLTLWLWLLPITSKAGVLRNVGEDQCTIYWYGNLLKADCSNLNLSQLPNSLDSEIQYLDLSNNNFLNFPETLQNFTGLRRLDFSGNGLNSPLPDFMGSMFVNLNLSNNNYYSWMNTGRRYEIYNLDLSKNSINAVDDNAFNDMPYLSTLDLSDNRLRDLPPDLFSATRIENLIFTKNPFTTVPKITSSTVTFLTLRHCSILDIAADSLAGMHSILHVDLSRNVIESIPDNLASNTLQILNLSNNDISSINGDTFSSLPHLAVLDLRGNLFTVVWSTSYFSSNPFLREVYVQGNPWSCESFGPDLLFTYQFLTEEPAKVSDLSSLVCYTPRNVSDLSWREAYLRTWHPDFTSESTFTYIAVMAGLIVGVLLTSVICRCLTKPEQPARPTPETAVLNQPVPAVEATVMRIPLREEDLPPTYDEALLMPRLNSFHSLPDIIDLEENNRRHTRSRSIGDLVDHVPRTQRRDRRSVRRTVEIRINDHEID